MRKENGNVYIEDSVDTCSNLGINEIILSTLVAPCTSLL